MVNYKSCKARPPFSVGLSLQDICNKFGIAPKAPVVETPAEEPKEEPQVEETKLEEEITEEPVVAPEPEPVVEETVVEEPVVEEPVSEPVAEETPVEETPAVTPLTELGITAKQIRMLESNNINSVEDLIAFEGDLEDLPKIGRAAKQAVMEALTKWQNEANQTSSTKSN